MASLTTVPPSRSRTGRSLAPMVLGVMIASSAVLLPLPVAVAQTQPGGGATEAAPSPAPGPVQQAAPAAVPESAVAAPADGEPVVAEPAEPAPVRTAPVDPAPVDSAPISSAGVGPRPVDPDTGVRSWEADASDLDAPVRSSAMAKKPASDESGEGAPATGAEDSARNLDIEVASEEGLIYDDIVRDENLPPVLTEMHNFGVARDARDVAGTSETGGVAHNWPRFLIEGSVEAWLGAPQRCSQPFTIQTEVMEGTRAQFETALGDGIFEYEENRGRDTVRSLEWIVTLPDPVPCEAPAAGEQTPPGQGGSGSQGLGGENAAAPGDKTSGEAEQNAEPGTIVVADAPTALVAAPATATAQNRSPADRALAHTGAEIGVLASVGALLVAAGAGLLAARRRV